MSSKYNRFLLSTCLPLMAVAMLSHTQVAHAGFEWTPPEKVEATPLPPVAPEAVISEKLDGDNSAVEVFEPEVFIGIPEEKVDTDVEEMITESAVNENSADITSENIIEEVAVKEEAKTEIQKEAEAEIIEEIGEEVIIETEATITPKEPETFSLSPFPVEDEETIGSSNNEEMIVLPSDSDENISEIVVTETKPVAEEISWVKSESFDIIEGFGSEMPLALALRQIVPAKYAFSFGAGVNPGASISWTGGKPWNEVLENALSSINVIYKLDGNKLKLSNTPIQVQEEIETIIAPSNDIAEISEPITIIEETIDENDNIEEQLINEVIQIINDKSDISPDIKQIEEVNIGDQDMIEIIEVEEKEDNKTSGQSSKRAVVLDPGEIETNQPITSDVTKENDLLTKKNEVALTQDNNINSDDAPDLIKTVEIPPADELIGEFTAEEEIAEISSEVDILPIKIDNTDNKEAEPPVTIEEIPAPSMDKSKADVMEVVAKELPSFRTEPSNIMKIWKAKRGAKLEDILKKWSDEENIELIIDLSNNCKIDKNMFINGTFKNALKILFSKGVKNAPPYVLITTPAYILKVDL